MDTLSKDMSHSVERVFGHSCWVLNENVHNHIEKYSAVMKKVFLTCMIIME